MSADNEVETKLEDDAEGEPEEVEEGSSTVEEEKANLKQMQQLEEAKLKSKYPTAIRPGGTSFLQKRLNKGKYFDSGDYNMAKAKAQKRSLPAVVAPQPTGEAIPTPDSLPTRKTSLVQSKLAAGLT